MVACASAADTQLPKVALKTNLLYDATTTLNLGVEIGLASKWSLDVSANYNPWTFSDNKKWKHWLLQPELRYWRGSRMSGSFFAAHLFAGQFNMGGWSTGFSFLGNDLSVLKDHRVEGWMAGAGIGYGYAWHLAKHWNMSAEIALGYAYMNYDKFKCAHCGDKIEADKTHRYVGPTKIALNLIYVFGGDEEEQLPVIPYPEAEPQPVQPVFAYAYIRPQTQAVESREIENSAHLNFVLNRSDIRADYGNNAAELRDIDESIRMVRSEGDIDITAVALHGYASPDGSYAHNEQLAAQRTEALASYLKAIYPEIPATAYTTTWTAEDWDGVRSAIVATLDNAEAMTAIIDDTSLTPDQKDRALRQAAGSACSILVDSIYPTVRRTDYRISYSVRHFDIERGRRMLHEQPQRLSLNQMYLIADSYDSSTAEFRDVFDVAVLLYPDDNTANVNAANNALARGDTDSAARYLDKAGDGAEALNARGILAAMRGDNDSARALFDAAAAAGLPQATENAAQLNSDASQQQSSDASPQ